MKVTHEADFEVKMNGIVKSGMPYTIVWEITDCNDDKYEAEFEVLNGLFPTTELKEACTLAFQMCDDTPKSVHVSIKYHSK